VFVFCSDLQEFPGLVWCRGKRFFRERGRRRTAATVAGGGGAAAGDFGNLLISFWRFVPELASKSWPVQSAKRRREENYESAKDLGNGTWCSEESSDQEWLEGNRTGVVL
jgi:hypothetical protein